MIEVRMMRKIVKILIPIGVGVCCSLQRALERESSWGVKKKVREGKLSVVIIGGLKRVGDKRWGVGGRV